MNTNSSNSSAASNNGGSEKGRISGAYADAPPAPALVPVERRPKSISLGALLDMDLPEREHLVLPWLRQAESAMVYAAPGVGKSLVALSLALAVAGGGKVLGKWAAPKPRRVLFVDGEMPIDDIKARAAMLLPATGGDQEAMRRNLHIEARQFQPAGSAFTDLAKEESRETLIEKVTRNKVELVILDNLSTLAEIGDENAAGDFNDAVKFLLRLKQEGVACMLVHHSNKSGESYRGSSKIATTFEVIMKLAHVDLKATDSPDTTRFRLEWDKFRGKREEGTGVPLDFALETKLFDDAGDSDDRGGGDSGDSEGVKAGQLQWVSTLTADENLARLLELVRGGDCGNVRELKDALGVSAGTVQNWKAKAIAGGHITDAEWQEYLPGVKGGSRKARQQAAGDNPDF